MAESARSSPCLSPEQSGSDPELLPEAPSGGKELGERSRVRVRMAPRHLRGVNLPGPSCCHPRHPRECQSREGAVVQAAEGHYGQLLQDLKAQL